MSAQPSHHRQHLRIQVPLCHSKWRTGMLTALSIHPEGNQGPRLWCLELRNKAALPTTRLGTAWPWQHTTLAAAALPSLLRPVRLAVSRSKMLLRISNTSATGIFSPACARRMMSTFVAKSNFFYFFSQPRLQNTCRVLRTTPARPPPVVTAQACRRKGQAPSASAWFPLPLECLLNAITASVLATMWPPPTQRTSRR